MINRWRKEIPSQEIPAILNISYEMIYSWVKPPRHRSPNLATRCDWTKKYERNVASKIVRVRTYRRIYC